MSQAFEVRLTAVGPNRVPVLARIRPLLGFSLARCRSLADAGNLIVARDLTRDTAQRIAAELQALGSTATVSICGCGCSAGPDHFSLREVQYDVCRARESREMEHWTINVPSEGRYRLHINHGGTPFWCMFDFAVRPAPESSGAHFALRAGADPLSAEWFPHLRQGMLQGLAAVRDRGREWVGIRVEICKIHTHPTDTTASGCERYGFEFVHHELPRRGVRLPE